MRNLMVMIGIPGSGKSTWVSKNQNKAVIISPDQYLLEHHNYEWSIERVSDAWADSYQRYAQLLKAEKDVIWDATFTRMIDRSAVLNIAIGFGYHCTAVYLDTSLEVCLDRNEHRNRRPVPPNTILHMSKGIQLPTKEEGFHAIVSING
jgi:predicted kinase